MTPTGRTQALRSLAAVMLVSSMGPLGYSAAAKTTVSFFANPRIGGANKDVMELLVESFNKQQSGVFVKYVPATGDWPDKVLSQMAAGTAPDIVACWDNILRSYIESGLATDLSPYFTASELADFTENQLSVLKVKGKLYGVPHYMGVSCLYYNTETFKSRGVAPPKADWNWYDMLDAAQKTTVQSGTGKPSKYGYGLYADWSRMYLWVLENGGKIFDDGQVLGTKVYLDKQASIDAFSFQRDLIYKYGVAPNSTSSPWESFGAGKVATFQSGSWDLAWLMANSKVEWNIALRPQGPKGDKASTFTTDSFILTKGCKNKREAVKFLKYLTSPAAEELMMDVANLQPARKSLGRKYSTESKAARAGYSMKSFVDAMPYATNTPMFLKHKRVWEILNPALIDSVFGANGDVVRNLKRVTAQINAISGVK